MVTVGMNYELLPGKNEMFESVFDKVIKVMSGLGGHVKTNLFVDTKNPNRYLILSEWTDRVSFDKFIASEQFKNVANWGKEQVLAARPHHQYYGDEQGDEHAIGATSPAAGCPAAGH